MKMKYNSKSDAVLLLEDGTVFFGKSAGMTGTATGEICFNTGMTGYQEIFTDPSYFGQIMLTTNAHIGNYGIHTDEVESDKMKISGLICKNYNLNYSRPSRVVYITQILYNHKNQVCDYISRSIQLFE